MTDASTEWASRVVPEQSVLLVVDVQNDFCHDEGALAKGGLQVSAIQGAVETLLSFLEMARGVGVPIVFVKTEHGSWTNSPAWVTRPVRARGLEICAAGSWGAEFYRVRPVPEDCVLVKHRYSAFVGTNLEIVLRSLGRPTVLLTGVTSNVCVESTARDAAMRDYYAVLVEDCVAAPTKAEHESALHNIRTYFGQVVDSARIAAAWRASNPNTEARS